MNSEEVIHCPVCQGTQFREPLTCTDHTATKEVFHVKHCTQCSLGITSPRPLLQFASRYYESDKYISHGAKTIGTLDSIYLIIRHLTVRWKFRLVRPYLRTGALLDYGCGTGSFLEAAKKSQSRVQGVEPAPAARMKVASDIPVVATLEELPPQKFDVITLWHVLEHVYPLRETLRSLKEKLNEHGAIFIAVPNRQSPDAQHYNANWAAYDVPRHLWHFTKQSMATFLRQEGLRVVKILPMKLDAYYVGLLSERNAHPGSPGFVRMLRATWVAFRSNLAARRETNYSSLIYVVQK